MRTAVAILILGLVAVHGAVAQTSTGLIRVHIRDRQTSIPIRGAQVLLLTNLNVGNVPTNEADLLAYLTNLSLRSGSNTVIFSQGPPPTLTQSYGTPMMATDADGSALTAVAPGRYSVAVSRDGYLADGQTVTIDVEAGETYEVSLLLEPAASIKGLITDAAGRPMANARVTAMMIEGRLEQHTVRKRLVAVADNEGRYGVTSLPPGNWLISVATPVPAGPTVYYPGTREIGRATLIAIDGPQPIIGVDLIIPD